MSEYYRAFLATLKNGDLERRTDTETGEEAIFQNGCLVASSSERKVFPDNLYTEIIKPEPHIIAFGAGHIGKALYDLSDLLSMKFTILDDRAELLTEERFPNAERHVAPYSKLLEREYNAFSPYYAIFTHGHEYDTACLEYALSHKSSYIGMIGSKGKVARTYDILRERGINEEKLMKVHAPIGLGIGAETPEEIRTAREVVPPHFRISAPVHTAISCCTFPLHKIHLFSIVPRGRCKIWRKKSPHFNQSI